MVKCIFVIFFSLLSLASAQQQESVDDQIKRIELNKYTQTPKLLELLSEEVRLRYTIHVNNSAPKTKDTSELRQKAEETNTILKERLADLLYEIAVEKFGVVNLATPEIDISTRIMKNTTVNNLLKIGNYIVLKPKKPRFFANYFGQGWQHALIFSKYDDSGNINVLEALGPDEKSRYISWSNWVQLPYNKYDNEDKAILVRMDIDDDAQTKLTKYQNNNLADKPYPSIASLLFSKYSFKTLYCSSLVWRSHFSSGAHVDLDDENSPAMVWPSELITDNDVADKLVAIRWSSDLGGIFGKLHKNSAKGQPISGATVICGGKPDTTKPDGTFKIDDIPAGDQYLSFSKSGFQPYSMSATIKAGTEINVGDRWLTIDPSVNPVIAQGPMSGPPGTTFTQWGTGFTPNSNAILHFRKPDGTEYPTQTQGMDSIGHFDIKYTSPTNKPIGTYTWWGIDGPTKIKSNEVAYKITQAPPSSLSVSPTNGSWNDTPHNISIACSGAERIYCTLRTTTDGSTPPDPPEPIIESHDPVDKGVEYISGTSGTFSFWGASSAIKKIKVRFRGYNAGGYGPPSQVYSYSIDLR